MIFLYNNDFLEYIEYIFKNVIHRMILEIGFLKTAYIYKNILFFFHYSTFNLGFIFKIRFISRV